MSVSKAFFKDTEYKNNLFLYHDALSLMTEEKYKEWMDEMGYLNYWMLSELGLNDDIDNFCGRPVKASPEFIPLDASLKKYVHELVSRHYILSWMAMSIISDANNIHQF